MGNISRTATEQDLKGRPLTVNEARPRTDRPRTGGGVLMAGTKGMIMCSTYGDNPRLPPESLMKDYKRPEKTIPRSPGIAEEWIAAIKAGKKSTTDIPAYSGPLTEVMFRKICPLDRRSGDARRLEKDVRQGPDLLHLARPCRRRLQRSRGSRDRSAGPSLGCRRCRDGRFPKPTNPYAPLTKK